MTTNQLAYLAYLESDHWKCLRRSKLVEQGCRCQQCRSTHRLQVHHLRYRFPWTDCILSDLQVLCRHCHELAHGIKPGHPKIHPHIAGSAKGKRWNSLGQRVDRQGRSLKFESWKKRSKRIKRLRRQRR